ncbi:MAG: pyruvate kinase [Candidatus Brocadiia bacterium]
MRTSQTQPDERIVPMDKARTKTVATIGPACSDENMLARMMDEGVNVFRLNFSHGTHAQHSEYVRRIRSLGKQKGRPVAIMQDLQGPRIRTGSLEGGEYVRLEKGDEVTIEHGDFAGNASRVATEYEHLARDVTGGDSILLKDGMIELTVTQVSPPAVRCRVRTGGVLGQHEGMNLPGVELSISSPTQKDLEDLRFAFEHALDYVALSYVAEAEDVERLRGAMGSFDSPAIPIVSKIERPEALGNLQELLGASDAVMVARGDLGIEMPTERVPGAQKDIIAGANEAGLPVITATQMLESMIHNPRPTRAEASDVANAILDGTDAVMLSGETAVGEFPVEAVRMMERIDSATSLPPWRDQYGERQEPDSVAPERALAGAACDVARRVSARAIMVFTITGRTARDVARERPPVRIHALTPSEPTRRRLSLVWGVEPMRLPVFSSTDEMIERGEEKLRRRGLVEPGDLAVCVAGASTGTPGGTDMLKVHRFTE